MASMQAIRAMVKMPEHGIEHGHEHGHGHLQYGTGPRKQHWHGPGVSVEKAACTAAALPGYGLLMDRIQTAAACWIAWATLPHGGKWGRRGVGNVYMECARGGWQRSVEGRSFPRGLAPCR